MKKLLFLLLLVPCLKGASQSFGAGNIVIVRIGTGDAAMTAGVAQHVYLDEYTTCGQRVRSIAMPDTVIGSNKRLTLPISTADYSEGYISLSQDGQYLALAGYDANVGTASVSTTASSTVNRVVCIVNASGTVNTSTAFSNRFTAVAVRSAVADGSNIWATGGGSGVVYAAVGSTGTTNTLISTTTARSLGVYGGQLYATTTATGFRMASIGTGLPTTTGQTFTNFPGYTTTDGSPYQYFLTHVGSGSGANVLYVADNNLLKKYSLVSGSWVANGTIGVSGDKYRGLTGVESGGTVTLYAVRRNDNTIGNGGEVVRFVDNTGYNANFSALEANIIVQADDNVVFRSIAMAPQGASLRATLTSFTGNLIDKEVKLKWETINELNNAYFNVQQSADGKVFNTIGKVNAVDMPTDKNEYRFLDVKPTDGVSYYRLEQIDKDGKKTLLPVVRISITDKPNFQVIAKEGTNSIETYITTNKTLSGTLNIYDMNGQQIANRTINADKGSSRFIIELPVVAKGIYMATFITKTGEVLTNKFMK